MLDSSTSIDQFLRETAARTPTPGGGSVAALVGALSASIGEMAVQFSLGKKDLLAHQPLLAQVATELQRARHTLLQIMVEDQQAFAALTAARKLPPDAPERTAAAEACSLVPQVIGATGLAVLQLCDCVVDVANKNLLSDLAVSAELAMATVRTASYNTRVNLSGITDVTMREALGLETKKTVERARELLVRLMPRIWARIEAG